MDLFMGRRENGSKAPVPDSFQLGTVRVFRNGPSLLTKKFQVKFRVERNLLNFHPEYRIGKSWQQCKSDLIEVKSIRTVF